MVAAEGADVIVIETMTDLLETKAAVLAAKENSNLPVMTTMTFEENKRTFTGCSVSAMCLTLQGLGVDALGVNCSFCLLYTSIRLKVFPHQLNVKWNPQLKLQGHRN